ncbi:MAG: Mov34/MPN/PAD-1 family protein [Gemmatimonadota bacterium]
MSRIVLSGALLAGILRHLEGAYPHEGVGALLGTPDGERRRVERHIPLANAVSRNRRRRYEVAPEELVRVQRDARGDGLEVLGYYHSHPDAEPVPSEADREAGWPWYVYVIVRVAGGRARGAGGITAWQLRDDRSTFDPVHLEVLES